MACLEKYRSSVGVVDGSGTLNHGDDTPHPHRVESRCIPNLPKHFVSQSVVISSFLNIYCASSSLSIADHRTFSWSSLPLIPKS